MGLDRNNELESWEDENTFTVYTLAQKEDGLKVKMWPMTAAAVLTFNRNLIQPPNQQFDGSGSNSMLSKYLEWLLDYLRNVFKYTCDSSAFKFTGSGATTR